MTTPATTPGTAAPPVHTHGCARCGRPVAMDVGLCEECNPLGLRDAASSQAHGTVFLGIGLAVLVMAIAAHLAVSGIGPFPAQVSNVRADGGTLLVSLTVTNEGTSAGTTTCRVSDPALRGAGQPAFILSPRIGPKQTVTFERAVPGIGGATRPLTVECSSP
jgi:hypothetical protein